jgi:hypothetical protein
MVEEETPQLNAISNYPKMAGQSLIWQLVYWLAT